MLATQATQATQAIQATVDARAHVVRELVARTGLAEAAAAEMERGVYNWALAKADERNIARTWRNWGFRMLYDSKARSVVANVDPACYVGNAGLLERVRRGEVPAHDVAGLAPADAFPERWRDALARSSQRDRYIQTARPTAACVTDQFRCARCKRRECSYYEMQTRSCDEPASLFVQCLARGHAWRMG